MAADARWSPLIAVFTRAPVAGRGKTRLARIIGEAAALDLQRALLERTLQAVTASAIDAEIWLDGDSSALPAHRLAVRHQRDGDLGQRMLDVIGDITARGRPAILIGSDCPVLDPPYLHAAADALSSGADLVVGPVEDGGYVLIGMRRPHPDLLLGMTWSTSSVCQETLRRAREAGLAPVVLDRLWDVDDEASWRRWQRLSAATTDR
jgi:hypothetical protein